MTIPNLPAFYPTSFTMRCKLHPVQPVSRNCISECAKVLGVANTRINIQVRECSNEACCHQRSHLGQLKKDENVSNLGSFHHILKEKV